MFWLRGHAARETDIRWQSLFEIRHQTNGTTLRYQLGSHTAIMVSRLVFENECLDQFSVPT